MLVYRTNYRELIPLIPSREAATCTATQELPIILWNQEVNCRLRKGPPLVPVLSQINPLHSISYYISKIHFNSIHSPTFWSLFRPSFPIIIPYALLLTHVRATVALVALHV
jgi:hypothetical protein